MGEESRGYRNSYSITQQGFRHLPLTIPPILPVPRSYRGTCMAVVRQQSFHLPSTQLPLRKQAFRVMLGLFISYKDVIRQISSADTRGCVFNGCVLPRLVISRQPLLRNHTLHPRPCIRNLTTSSSAVMKAYVSHRLGLSHLPARFDVGIHAEPLCKSLVYARVSFSSRLSMPSFWHGDVFKSNGCVFASEAQTFIWANHLYGSIHQGPGLRVQVSCCE